jgi:hypothetical protein
VSADERLAENPSFLQAPNSSSSQGIYIYIYISKGVYLQFGLGKKASLFAHHLLVDTSAKRKKKKKHKTILNHAAADQRRKKRERRRKKEEKKRKKKEQRRVSPALTSSDLAGARLAESRWVSPETHGLFFCFFFSGRGSRNLTSPSPSLVFSWF